jgi:xylan 1,4-beta-xylosidase
MTAIRNPVLPGFHPDPSIVRVGPDYFLATSTFEWFPGVRIYHSRDLATWTLAACPLVRPGQLDLRGDPDSCGVWAPDLSYADGRFHLVFTAVKRYGRTPTHGATGASLRDFHNLWVWSERIEGPWSDPMHLNSTGFDPSLFHDDDGTSWLLNMLWDHRPGRNRFAGIVAQRVDLAAGGLVGVPRTIFAGTSLGFTEGPHLYKREGWYHLLVAEGGTGRDHAVTMARSRSLLGPYEPHPDGPVLTAANRPASPLARTGHGDLVETPDGETWMAYLCGRPLPGADTCVLGRETALQRMAWGTDGWLRTLRGDALPALDGEMDLREPPPEKLTRERHEFDGAELPPSFQWLRSPYPERLFSLTARPGRLRLFGRETIGSLFEHALVARRQQAWRYTAVLRMEVAPVSFQQAAGLVCWYNGSKFHYLHITADEDVGRHLRVLSVIPAGGGYDLLSDPVALPSGPLDLRADVDLDRVRFAYRLSADTSWTWLPEVFDASILSDEATLPGQASFTGAFVGMGCHDMTGSGMIADFAFFDYAERDAPALDNPDMTAGS